MQAPSYLSLFPLLGLLLLVPGPALSEARAPDGVSPDAPETAPPDPVAQLREALAAAKESVEEAVAFDTRVAGATGEKRAVLIAQQSAKADEAADRLSDLLNQIAQQGEEQAIPEETRQKTVSLLDYVDEWNERQLQREAVEFERVRASREEAPTEELLKIDERLSAINARYDELLKSRFKSNEARASIGVDTTRSGARLDELLEERAAERAGAVRVTRKRLADLRRQAASAQDEEAKRINALVSQQSILLEERVESLQMLSDMLEQREVSSSEYRQLIIEATGKMTVDIFDREVAAGLLQQGWKRTKVWLETNGPSILFNLVVGLAILAAAHLVGRLSQRIIRRAIHRERTPVSRLFQEFVLTSAYRVALGLGVLVALSQLGVEITPVLAGLGVASFILGFALQETLSNFASGMLILAYRPFDVGDVVNAGGVAGRVDAMTLVSTTILTFDNQRLIVPNSKIWGDVITNVTAERIRRVDLTFGIGYGDDIEHAERVLREIVETHPKVLETPEPLIRLHELGDSSVNFVVRPWSTTVDYWDVYWDLTREVKRRFDAEGISIPFPQRDVHLHPQGDAPG